MADPISVCITLGPGRTRLVERKLHQLTMMDYPVRKKLEVCVTCNVDDPDLVGLLKRSASSFMCVRYARSRRDKLTFSLPKSPTSYVVDVNTQICNVAGCEKIVRTDPEVMFTNPASLQLIDETLNQDRTCLGFWCLLTTPQFRWPQDVHNLWKSPLPNALCCEFHWAGFFCAAFKKSDFIAAGGVDERFAHGYGGDDTYFHIWWQGNRKLVMAPKKEHAVVHLHHGTPTATQAFSNPGRIQKLHDEYTMPLLNSLMAKNEKPNKGNPDWQHPEMIEEIKTWH